MPLLPRGFKKIEAGIAVQCSNSFEGGGRKREICKTSARK